MNIFDAMNTRRAVKSYDPDHVMDTDEQSKILDMARLTPTAFNIQHWRFVVVNDPALRGQIRKHAWDQSQVTDASMLVILCADIKAWAKDPARYWHNTPQPVQDFLVPAIGEYYGGNDGVQRDEAHRSCGMAGMSIMLAATAMGYDSCPMDGFDFDAVGKLINLPDDHIISFMIAIGKKAQEPFDRPARLTANEVVITDKFPCINT